MGWGRDEALRIKAQQQAQQSARDWQTTKLSILQRDSARLWEGLCAELAKAVEEFSRELPSAASLRAVRVNPNNLTVETTLQPMVRSQVVFEPARFCFRFDLSKQRPGLYNPMEETPFGEPVYMDIDSKLGTGFATEKDVVGVSTMAQILLAPVFEFFGE